MTDPAINAILTGLFTGLGIVVANWIGEKYIKPRLDKTHNRLFKKKEEQ
jgi:hypothetical protein